MLGTVVSGGKKRVPHPSPDFLAVGSANFMLS